LSAFKGTLGVAAVVTLSIIAGLLCAVSGDASPELDGTEGMVETVGEVETGLRGTIKYRIFRHPESEPEPSTASLLRRAVARTERYMGEAFPAKTAVLVFDDSHISQDMLGQFRYLPGASFFGSISHSLASQWMRMEIRPDQEKDLESLKSVLAHEVAHYYWHHQAPSAGQQDFLLDEGAAHFLEYKLGGNGAIATSAQLAGVCKEIRSRELLTRSQLRDVVNALDIKTTTAERRLLQASSEFSALVSWLCSQPEFVSRYSTAGIFIQADRTMGPSDFQNAFQDIWEASKSGALDHSDVLDTLCAHTSRLKCGEIKSAFLEYGFVP
jgi:hypothetical protein